MNIILSYESKCMIAKLKGELDHHTAVLIKESLQKEIQKEIATNIILDLSELKFMDSSGIGVILGRFKEIQKIGGKLVIAGMNDTVNKIFNLSGLQKIIKTFDSVPKAVTSLKEEK